MLSADLPVIQSLHSKVFTANEGHLRPAVAYVLVYEMLFGQVHCKWLILCTTSSNTQQTSQHQAQGSNVLCMQGCRVKGKAEKAVYAMKVHAHQLISLLTLYIHALVVCIHSVVGMSALCYEKRVAIWHQHPDTVNGACLTG